MYDVTIIGAGPGGYAAALRARELGLKTCLVEKEFIGGTCLNRGCIPTKTLASSVKYIDHIRRSKDFGVNAVLSDLDMHAIMQRKESMVSNIRSGAEAFLKAKGVDLVFGSACIADKNTVKVNDRVFPAKNIIVATGSQPVDLPCARFDPDYVLSSTEILQLDSIPRAVIIVGGGYIGCEFASIFNKLGSHVTIIEIADQILPGADKECARRLESIFKRDGINIIKSKTISSIETGDKVTVMLNDNTPVSGTKVLLSVGRKPLTGGLGLEHIGVKTQGHKILVDEAMRTSVENIYAVGDAAGLFCLAHTASYQGIIAAENIAGIKRCADYSVVPSCIFTLPEIASVGMTEEAAKASGKEISVSKIPFSAVSKAHAQGETEGFIKLISEKNSGRILGCHIMGASASELIAPVAIAMQNSITVKQLSETIFAHPTLSEGIFDAACRAARS